MMEELPKGWTISRIEGLFRSFSGGTPNKSVAAYWNGPIPWLSSGDIKSDRVSSSTFTISAMGLRASSAKLCRAGSMVVVVRSGILKHTLPVAILDRDAAINQDLKCFDSGDDDLNRWFAMALKASSQDILAQNREGTTVQSVKYETLKSFELPVPPIAEQQRLLVKLDGLIANAQECQERLAKVSTFLKRFRQSVLAAACSGRLTADWRGRNLGTRGVDTIITTIERRQTISSKTPAQRERWREIFSALEDGIPEDLPANWRFVKLNKLVTSFDYGTAAKSSRSGRIPVLRMGNLQGGEIDWSDLVYTSHAAEIRHYSLSSPAVLFNRTNSPELVGKTAIYRGERPAIFAGYLIRINLHPELNPEYLNICLNSPYAREFCASVKTDGVSQSNINAQKLGAFELPFCNPTEQQEIVCRVKGLFALADKIEARYEAVKRQVNRLPQSILAKAFRGELVPTEAELAERKGRTYESAEQLLTRIRTERATTVSRAQHRTSKKRTART
jgi:type I restriction enzyme S subunit